MIDHSQREQDIIGMLHAVMIKTEDLNQVSRYADKLSVDDFGSSAARAAFKHIQRFILSGQGFDPFSLKDAIESDSRASGNGYGDIILDACQRNIVSYISLDAQIGIQKKYATRMKAMRFIEQLHQDLTETDDVHAEIGRAISFFESVTDGLSFGHKASVHISQVASEYINQLEYDINHKDVPRGLSTGFAGLDSILGLRKLKSGTMLVIGGRPGSGKTSLMTYIMVHQARNHLDKAFLCYTMEMPRVSLYERIVNDQTGISYENTLNGDEMAFEKTAMLTTELRQTQLYMNDSSNMSIEDIEADARAKAKDIPVGAIFVDYLTLINMPKKDRHDLSVGEITRRLKKLSIELDCVVVLLSQLNRNVDERKNKRPIIKDLRDSGSIEQDADYILFPYRDVYYDQQSLAGNYVELSLAKNRHGATGIAYAEFTQGRFIDCDQDHAETRCLAARNESSGHRYATNLMDKD